MKNILAIIFSCCINIAWAQCDHMYSFSTEKSIPNIPAYNLEFDTRITIDELQKVNLLVDTIHNTERIYRSHNFSAQFKYEFTDSFIHSSNLIRTHVIKDLANGRTTQLGVFKLSGYYDARAYYLYNCFILVEGQIHNERQVIVYSYHDASIKKYNLAVFDAIGYNDTCVFVEPYIDFSIDNKKYHAYSRVAIGVAGASVILSATKKQRGLDVGTVIFYSDKFVAEKNHLYNVERDCYTESYYSMNVKYKEQTVDSVKVHCRYNCAGSATYAADTLWLIVNDIWIRKYYKGQLLGEWDIHSWAEKMPVVGDSSIWDNRVEEIYNTGNLLLVKLALVKNYAAGLKKSLPWTLNNVMLRKDATQYSLVLAFDLYSHTFLGYPQITFKKPVN